MASPKLTFKTVDDDIRERLLNAVAHIRAYAHSSGRFHDLADVRIAITLAIDELDKAMAHATRLHGGGHE